MKETPEIRKLIRRKKWKKPVFKLLKTAYRLSFYFFLSFIFLAIIVQTEIFQNWAINKTTSFLSDELSARVKIDFISIDFFDKFVLNGFLIEDQCQDTILYSDGLRLNFEASLFSLFNKQLIIEDVRLSSAKINIYREAGNTDNNLQFILDYLSSDKKKKKKKKKKEGSQPFLLGLEIIYFDNINYQNIDAVSGKSMFAEVVEGNIVIDSLDFKENSFRLEKCYLKQPVLSMSENQPAPLPPQALDSTEVKKKIVKDKSDKKDPSLYLEALILEDGTFQMDKFKKSLQRHPQNTVIDFKHLDVREIYTDIRCVNIESEGLTAQIERLSLRENSGFKIRDMRVDELQVSEKSAQLNGLRLQTENSLIGDTISFRYKSLADFKDFEDKVKFEGKFRNTQVSLDDIMAFVPKLNDNAFFQQNKNTILRLNGLVKGKVNNLSGKNLNIRLGRGGTVFQGSFSSHNLAIKNEEFLSLRLERLVTDMKTLRLLIPDFNPPNNFDKLGRLNFSGRFDGFFVDFVADGSLVSDLGRAEMDMRMNLIKGRAGANYSGNLSLIDFDLKEWSGNSNFGNITLTSEVKNSVGLTLETVNAQLGASIDSFFFKGYRYENIQLDGRLNKNLFEGDLNIKDENIDFTFGGKVDLGKDLPVFDFNAKVNKIDLKAVNLSKKNLVFAGSFDLLMSGENLSNAEGNALIYDLELTQDDTAYYSLDSLIVSSKIDTVGKKKFMVESDILSADISGFFDIEKIPNVTLSLIEKNYPVFAEKLKIKGSGKSFPPHKFDFNINIHDSKNLTRLFEKKLSKLNNIALIGHLDSERDSLKFDLGLPAISYDNIHLEDVVLLAELGQEEGIIDFGVYHLNINDSYKFTPISILGLINRDTVDFGISVTNVTSFLDNLYLNGTFFPKGDHYQVSFQPSNLILLNEYWEMAPDNYIVFGKNYLETWNFDLLSGEKEISIQSGDGKELQLLLNNFRLEIIDEYWNYKQLDFFGDFSLEVRAGNIFKLEDLSLRVHADTLSVNRDDWGVLDVVVNAPDIKSTADAYIAITRNDKQLIAEGTYNLPTIKTKSTKDQDQPNYFDFDLNVTNFPVKIAEYWIGAGVDNTVGRFDLDIDLDGFPKKPNLSGDINIYDTEITVKYLGTRYYIPQGYAKAGNYLFDATGSVLFDKYGNKGEIVGGISHDHLKKLGVSATITCDYCLGLDTKKTDNPLYYGRGLGKMEATFDGRFDRTNINVIADTGPGTELFIPISSESSSSEVSFIKFKDKDKDKVEIKGVSELKGINFEMNLNMNEAAVVSLIFDEQAGDIIKGSGNGNLDIFINRNGDFTMYGDYEIDKGEYLFTLFNVVNKPFTVKRGGTISWNGDPFNATINIDAEYKGLRTAPYNFILEYLGDEAARNQARQATDVDLTMNLQGELLQPEITFDIDFPTLTGELKNYTDSKKRTIQKDPNELNRQVFGLIVFGGFLPSESVFQDPSIAGINTLTELLSNQLSIYFTELLSEVFTDVGFISGVDFDIAYNVFETDIESIGEKVRGQELQVSLKNNLFNDRLSFDVGGNFEFSDPYSGGEQSTFITGNFVIEYVLSKDRRFKVRFYQRGEQELEGRRNKWGVGFNYQREFGEFVKGMKDTAKKAVQ